MAKILLVAPRFHTNQTYLVSALQHRGHAVEMFVLYRGMSEDHRFLTPHVIPTIAGVQISSPDVAMRYAPINVAWLVNKLRSVRPDVVVVRNPNFLPFGAVLLAVRALGIPAIVYTLSPKHRTWSLSRRALRFLYLDVLGCGWLTPILGESREAESDPRIHFVPFPTHMDPDASTRSYGRSSTVRFLAVGKFTERKNHRLLVQAFARACAERDIQLTIVGEVSNPSQEELHQQVLDEIAKRGLSGRVTVKTNVPFTQMRAIYRQHDTMVLAARDEPAGIALLEAMGHGLGVICSSTCGLRGYVADAGCGAIFASDSEKELLFALIRAAEPSVAQSWGRAAVRAVREHYTEDKVAEAFEALMRQLTPP